MPPKAESKYQSFEIDHKINLDKIIAGTATCLTIGGIIAYFIWEAYDHS